MKKNTPRIIFAAGLILLALAVFISVKIRPDINTCPVQEAYDKLMNIDWMKEEMANTIIENRPYKDWSQLENDIKGVGPERIKTLKRKFNLDEK